MGIGDLSDVCHVVTSRCSQKVEACGDSPENGYTADYVPTLTTPLDEQYDADLIAGDDTNFIGNKTSSVDCTLYMGEFEFACRRAGGARL